MDWSIIHREFMLSIVRYAVADRSMAIQYQGPLGQHVLFTQPRGDA